MGQLEAGATVTWQGMHGTIEGGSGALRAPTATQAELGGPGGATNPEELFAAAHANCFTSTLTGLARARGIELGHITTEATARLEWGESGDHALASSTLRVHVESRAPEADVRALLADAEAHCPVCRAIAGNVTMVVTADVTSTDGQG